MEAGGVLGALRAAKCPVRLRTEAELVGEARLQVLEWLLRAYDESLFEQCSREGGSRTSRLARQLLVLGMGGSRQAHCEAFVAGSGSSIAEETLMVVSELCVLVELSRTTSEEALQTGMAKDLEFPSRVAGRTAAYFGEPVSLFPAALFQKVNIEEQIDAEQLLQQLSKLLEKINAKAAVLEAQSKLEKQDVKFVDPKTVPQLVGVLQSFGVAIRKFNQVYQSEMALWKVASVKPNAQLADLALRVRQQQLQLTEFVESFQKTRNACRTIEEVGKAVVATLAVASPSDSGPQITEENVAETNRLALVLGAQ